jgi:L-iditol 2-dehydrogenase/galactitol-1-phosphate 5-dehydrogenase
MNALVLEAPGKLVYHSGRAEPAKDPAADCLRVRVVACGICGSDLPRAFDEGGAYHYPLVLGHEFSAVVEENGAGFRSGDRVAVFR